MMLNAGESNYFIYGIDKLISSMRSYLCFMKQLDLPEDNKELILLKNTSKLFTIDASNL